MPRRRTAPLLLTALWWPFGASAQQLQADTTRPRSPFEPDTVVTTPGRARVVVVRGPDSAVAALRLFVPLVETPDEAGIGRVLRDQALERMRNLARPFGARVDVERTPAGLAYSAAGAVADFETLAWLLRESTARPDVGGPEFGRARAALREEAARRAETPRGRIVADLRARVAPEVAPEAPSPAGVDALGSGAVLSLWGRTHRAAEMTLVVSAPVALEVMLAATQGIGLGTDGGVDAPPPPGPARPGTAETLRAWYGEAYAAGPLDDPTAAVAARFVARTLEGARGAWETSVQLWQLPGRTVLAVLGAAYPRDAAAMRAAVSGAVRAAAEGVDEPTVRSVSARLRRDRLFAARSTVGLVETVGRSLETADGADGLEAWLAALGDMDAATVRGYLRALADGDPVRAEVRP